MIRHLVSAVKRPASRNILQTFAASQYGGQVVQQTPRAEASPGDVDALLAAAGNMSIKDKIYKLPEKQQKMAIVDPKPFVHVTLPSGLILPKIDPTVQKLEISAPSVSKTEISCKSDLKQRRRHMNKHKLKKLRKRMKFVYMRLEQKKRKRKAILLKNEADEIINSAKSWDPLEEIKRDLEMAREGGFGIDVFDRKRL